MKRKTYPSWSCSNELFKNYYKMDVVELMLLKKEISRVEESLRLLEEAHLKIKSRKDYFKDEKLFDKETWKDVIGYEGLYQISNFGRVKSFKRPYKNSEILVPGRIRCKYSHVILNDNDGLKKTKMVSRLVAEHFVDKKSNKDNIVKHKDGNTLNTYWENLEWVHHNKKLKCK